jgi:hypothetical protein
MCAKQPTMCLQPQEALDFIAAPLVATHNHYQSYNQCEFPKWHQLVVRTSAIQGGIASKGSHKV